MGCPFVRIPDSIQPGNDRNPLVIAVESERVLAVEFLGGLKSKSPVTLEEAKPKALAARCHGLMVPASLIGIYPLAAILKLFVLGGEGPLTLCRPHDNR